MRGLAAAQARRPPPDDRPPSLVRSAAAWPGPRRARLRRGRPGEGNHAAWPIKRMTALPRRCPAADRATAWPGRRRVRRRRCVPPPPGPRRARPGREVCDLGADRFPRQRTPGARGHSGSHRRGILMGRSPRPGRVGVRPGPRRGRAGRGDRARLGMVAAGRLCGYPPHPRRCTSSPPSHIGDILGSMWPATLGHTGLHQAQAQEDRAGVSQPGDHS